MGLRTEEAWVGVHAGFVGFWGLEFSSLGFRAIRGRVVVFRDEVGAASSSPLQAQPLPFMSQRAPFWCLNILARF